jgi:hypothetical protein
VNTCTLKAREVEALTFIPDPSPRKTPSLGNRWSGLLTWIRLVFRKQPRSPHARSAADWTFPGL